MTIAKYKKISLDPLLVVSTTCLSMGVLAVATGMYLGTGTSTAPLSIPQRAGVPPVEPSLPRATATVPTDLSTRTSSKLRALSSIETTSSLARTQQIQTGRTDPFEPLSSDEVSIQPIPQTLPPVPKPFLPVLKVQPSPHVLAVPQYASRVVLNGTIGREDGKYSAIVQLLGEPSLRSVGEGQTVELGEGRIRVVRIENADTTVPRLILEENGVEVARVLGSSKLHLQAPVTKANDLNSAIIPVPFLPPVSESNRAVAARLPSPPSPSEASRFTKKPVSLPQRLGNKVTLVNRSLQPPGVSTSAEQWQENSIRKLRQPHLALPVPIQARQMYLHAPSPFLLPASSNNTSLFATERSRDLKVNIKLSQQQNNQQNNRFLRQQLVRRLKLSRAWRQPIPPTATEKRASSNWEQWQKIAGIERRK